MQEAGLMNFLRTILIILLIYYAFKFFARLLAPYFMKKMVHKMQKNAQQYQEQYHQHTSSVKEGETVIDKKPNASKESNSQVGDYVDFEEID